jgi:threonine dehydrogenase-like Zn-dependent dehydrogenase
VNPHPSHEIADVELHFYIYSLFIGLGLTFQLADFGHVIDALGEGRLRPGSMITRKISIDRVVEDGFNALINEKDKHVKVMVDLSA